MKSPVSELVSVIVTNFNYGQFLPECLDSVFNQSYAPLEIVVVDDGSTDHSRGVIASYGDRITPVLKENGGQISAMNAGFSRARGEIILFLDADDYLLPGAVKAHVEALRTTGSVRSQGYMEVIDLAGERTGERIPGRSAEGGDLRERVLDFGPGVYICPPTSANAWRRSYIAAIVPLPEAVRKEGGDAFLMDAAPLFGRIVTVERPVAAYRVHSQSQSQTRRELNVKNITKVVDRFDQRVAWLASIAERLGYGNRAARWSNGNWRVLMLRYLRARMSGQADGPNLSVHLRAAMRYAHSPVKKVARAATVAAIRILPRPLSMSLARRFLELNYI